MIKIANEILLEYGMYISIPKTKILIFNESESMCKAREEGDSTTTTITIREEEIEIVDEFKYLGSIITSRVGDKEDRRGGMWVEVEARKKAASRAFGMLRRSIF